MSIESQNRRNNYVGANNNNVYDYNFKLFDQNHVLVSVRNLTTGVRTDLSLITDYTVQFVNDSGGGTVTLVDDGQEWLDGSGYLDSNFELSLLLAPLPLKQPLDIKNNSEYYPIAHERQFDKLFQILLYQQDQLDRAIKLNASFDYLEFDTNLPEDILVNGAGKFLAVKDDLTGIELRNGTTADLTSIENAVDQLQIDVTVLQTAIAAIDLTGYVTESDLGAGVLYVAPSGLAVPTNTTYYYNNSNGYYFTLLNSTFTANRNVLISDRASFIPGNQQGGNFSPTIGLTSGSVTYSEQYGYGLTDFVSGPANQGSGFYTMHVRLKLSAISSPVNTALTINSIPFKRWNSYPVFTVFPVWVNNCTVTGQVFGKISHYSNDDEYKIELFAVNNGTATALSAASFLQSTSEIHFSCTFRVQDLV